MLLVFEIVKRPLTGFADFASAPHPLVTYARWRLPRLIMSVVARGQISGRTRLLALIGHPVGHSLSPGDAQRRFRL